MSADVLREAARLMRERAEAATQGPWTKARGRHGEGVRWHGGDLILTAHSSLARGDMRHVASWDPPVALAVAGWLDSLADAMTNPDAPDGSVSTDREERRALAVARAYLGDPS